MHTTTVILGGGFGGLTAARELRRLLPASERIVLVDRNPEFTVGATKTWVMLGETERADVEAPRRGLVPDGVEYLEASVDRIDAAAMEVLAGGERITADALVLALGTAHDMDLVPGLASEAESFYSFAGAERLRARLQIFEGGRILVLIARTPFACPPAPYEAAVLIREQLRERGIEHSMRICTIEGAPMTAAGPEMGAFVRTMLAEHDIGFEPLRKTVRVDVAQRQVVFKEGAPADYDLLIAIPPHVAPPVLREAGLVAESGWVAVDPETLRVKAKPEKRIFAIGDCAGIPLPGRFRPDMPLALPKAGTLAASQGAVVATQIAAELGHGTAEAFDGRGSCWIELSRTVAMRGDAEFFATPHPTMRPGEPGEDASRAKRSWVEAWLTGRHTDP